jgi:hypothetical protein
MYTSSADSSSLIFFSRGYPHTGQAIHPAFVGIILSHARSVGKTNTPLFPENNIGFKA